MRGLGPRPSPAGRIISAHARAVAQLEGARKVRVPQPTSEARAFDWFDHGVWVGFPSNAAPWIHIQRDDLAAVYETDEEAARAHFSEVTRTADFDVSMYSYAHTLPYGASVVVARTPFTCEACIVYEEAMRWVLDDRAVQHPCRPNVREGARREYARLVTARTRTVLFTPTHRVERGCTKRGRPAYRWHQGYAEEGSGMVYTQREASAQARSEGKRAVFIRRDEDLGAKPGFVDRFRYAFASLSVGPRT